MHIQLHMHRVDHTAPSSLELELVSLTSTSDLSRLGRLGLLSGSGVFPETVLEPPRNTLQMLHPSSPSRLSALSL